MKFFIRHNKNAKKGWKTFSKLLFNAFYILLALNVFLKLTKSEYKSSNYYNFISWFILSIGLLGVALDLIHWLKPKWFEVENK